MAISNKWFKFAYENNNFFKLEMGDDGVNWDKVVHIQENTHINAIWNEIKKISMTVFDCTLDEIGNEMKN